MPYHEYGIDWLTMAMIGILWLTDLGKKKANKNFYRKVNEKENCDGTIAETLR